VWDGAHAGNLTGLTDELAACVARTDLDSTVAHADELTLLAALMEPVEAAMDGLGWRHARCWPVEPRPGVRIYEISSPDQWTELVGRYPIDVSKSRRHDWWRATGWAGRWLIPDFAAVAADYDAVHLSVAGYLTTAGRALSVDDARTVLAGWDPDQAFWLTEVLTSSGPATDWVELDDEPLGWALSSAGG
jgi:hypothetical protein